jgi:hypothetical protein
MKSSFNKVWLKVRFDSIDDWLDKTSGVHIFPTPFPPYFPFLSYFSLFFTFSFFNLPTTTIYHMPQIHCNIELENTSKPGQTGKYCLVI